MSERPSLPHSLRRPGARERTPTAPRAPVVPASDDGNGGGTIGDAERERIENEQISAILRDPAGLSVDGILKLMTIGQRRAVIAAKQDDRLAVDLRVGAVDSRLATISASINAITGRFHRSVRFWRLLAVVATAFASATAALAASCKTVYEQAHADVEAPAIRAEQKTDELERRVSENERRHDATDAALQSMRDALDANTRAVLGIAAKLDQPTEVRVPAGSLEAPPKRAKVRP